MTFNNGDKIQTFLYISGDWQDATYIGPDPEGEGMHVVAINSNLVWRPAAQIREIPKPRYNYILVWRTQKDFQGAEIASSPWPSDGAARQYAFDRQLDVISIIPVEL